LGEKETGGFIDGCDTPPPEFWIHFDGENLYSFIPNEFTNIVSSNRYLYEWLIGMVYGCN
jgi:hypothetical protein